MKKLLFTLAAAATCGVAAAAPATATFDGATTFDPTKADDGGAISESNRGYWEIDLSTDPELVAAGEDNAALNYLQINTGSTPLWRTFAGVDSHVSATNAALDAAAVDADGVVVSSDVKLTACTEWPTLTDFANEKLALFLFAPEEGDTSGKTAGLYAVGGAMVEGNLTATAYRLNAEPNAITNTDGWATIAIKSYADVYVNNTGAKYPAFVIAACAKGSATTNILSVATGEAYAPGYTEANLSNAAKARIEDRELIPSAKTSDGKLVGLGFQGEGGIDNVSLATTDFAVDAVTMTATITDATVTWTSTGTSLNGTTLTFVPGSAVTFTVEKNAELDILTVTYNGSALTADENGVYTITNPAANAALVVTASAAAFQIGDAKYATLAEALAGLTSGSTLKLLSACEVGANSLTLSTAGTYTLDLNGQVISGSSARGVVMVAANVALTITNSNTTVEGGIANTAGAAGCAIANNGTLLLQAGKYTGSIVGAATITGGKFNPKPGNNASIGDKQWSEADTYGYYTLVDNVVVPEDPVPSIPENDESGTTIEKIGDDYVVTPGTGVTEVTVNTNGFAGKIAIPVSVEKVIGVAKEQLKLTVVVGENTYDIAGAIKIANDGTISLDKDAVVNGVKVEPELANGNDETPFVVGETTTATVKTIPGLQYSLVWDSDLSFTSDAKGGTVPVRATSNRMVLEDESESKPTKRFYKVKVTK